MIGMTLNQSAVRTRHVTVGTDLGIDVDETPGDPFACRILSPTTPDQEGGGSPRQTLQRSKLYYDAEQPLSVVDRVEVDGEAWELLSDPRPMRLATSVLSYVVEVLPPARLYPRTAALQEQGGDVIAVEVPVALYQPSQTVAGAADFEDLRADAPIEFAEALRGRNRALVLGSSRFVIAEWHVIYDAPHVEMQLRRPNG